MSALAGTPALVRLALRRDRVLLPLWIAALAVLPLSIVAAFAELYPSAAERAAFAEIANGNPALVAIFGPVFDPGLGGLVVWRSAPVAVVLALIAMVTVLRHTRTEEEAGRRELVAATVVGRHASLAAALVTTWAACLVLGAALAAGMIAQGLPADGSIAFGAAYAALGCVFAALGGLLAQLTSGAGAARGIGVAALGLAFLLRLGGDVSGDGGLSWLSWLSPLGWAQQVRPYGDERWWVLALALVAVAALSATGVALSSRRDVGAGLLPARRGPANAGPRLSSPLGLAWRMHRGLLLGWSAGFAVIGLVLGGVADGVRDLLRDNEELLDLFERMGGAQALVDAYLAAVLSIIGVVAAGYGIQAALRMRVEEAAGRAEPVLATAVSRPRWAVSHLLFAALGPALALTVAGAVTGLAHGIVTGDVAGEVPRVLAGALVQLPAVWVLAGVAVALFGLLPRLAAAVSWAALGIVFFLGQLGAILQLEQWALNLSPFTHVPGVPGEDVVGAPLLWLTAVALALAVVGVATFRRRDLTTE